MRSKSLGQSVLVSLLFSAALALPATAVIIAGANGGGNNSNNTTQAQLEAVVGAFPMYDNVIDYGGATGLYLGYNPATSDIWVLTARHIFTDASNGSTVVIQGQTYNRQSTGPDFGLLPGGDYRLVRYQRADLSVPTLPAIKISAAAPIAGSALVMIGNGQNRAENATLIATTSDAVSTGVGTGYTWASPGRKRWGTNNIESEFVDSLESPASVGVRGNFSLGVSYMTKFDEPVSPNWLSSNEAQGALGDSGGSAFYFDGTEWVLSGMMSAVSSFVGQTPSTAAFDNHTILADVATYKSAIDSAIGLVLIPEPSTAGLIALATAAFFTRRRV